MPRTQSTCSFMPRSQSTRIPSPPHIPQKDCHPSCRPNPAPPCPATATQPPPATSCTSSKYPAHYAHSCKLSCRHYPNPHPHTSNIDPHPQNRCDNNAAYPYPNPPALPPPNPGILPQPNSKRYHPPTQYPTLTHHASPPFTLGVYHGPAVRKANRGTGKARCGGGGGIELHGRLLR